MKGLAGHPWEVEHFGDLARFSRKLRYILYVNFRSRGYLFIVTKHVLTSAPRPLRMRLHRQVGEGYNGWKLNKICVVRILLESII